MNISKFAVTVAAVVLIFKTANLCGQSGIEAVNPSQNIGGIAFGYINDGTVGWAFSPSQDIVITSFELFFVGTEDPPPAGLSIGLWSTDGTLLRSTGIDANGVFVNGNFYESVSPLSVAAGSTLVVGAGSSDLFNIYLILGSPTQNPINFAGSAYLSGNGFAFPTVQSTIGDTERIIPSVSFLFQVVPEPNELALAVTGALLLAVRRKLHSRYCAMLRS
jgi:hypothetical protein